MCCGWSTSTARALTAQSLASAWEEIEVRVTRPVVLVAGFQLGKRHVVTGKEAGEPLDGSVEVLGEGIVVLDSRHDAALASDRALQRLDHRRRTNPKSASLETASPAATSPSSRSTSSNDDAQRSATGHGRNATTSTAGTSPAEADGAQRNRTTDPHTRRRHVLIGSRDAARAQAAADSVLEIAPSISISGALNAEVAAQSDTVVVAVPYNAQKPTLESLTGVRHRRHGAERRPFNRARRGRVAPPPDG